MYKPFSILFIFIFLCTSSYLSAQYGIRFQYIASLNDFPDTKNESSLSQGGMIALDYRYGFKNYRMGIGLMPYAKIIIPKGNFIIGVKDGEGILLDNAKAFGANFTFTYYPLDIIKCDCPTINKKGLWLKQSLFLEPQLGYELRNYKPKVSDGLDFRDQFITAGLFVGVDMRMLSSLTLSPLLGVRKHFELGRSKRLDNVSNPFGVEVGLRLGWGLL